MTTRATCLTCGAEFESGGSFAEAIAEGQGASSADLERLRYEQDELSEERGGASGVCSLPCLLERVLGIARAPN